jgi:hypothetical protein
MADMSFTRDGRGVRKLSQDIAKNHRIKEHAEKPCARQKKAGREALL